MKELIEEDKTATEGIKYEKGTIYIIDNNVTGEGNASYVHSLAENISKYYDVIELVKTKFTWSVRSASNDGLYIQMKKSTFDALNSAHMNIKINVHNVQLPDYTSRNVVGQVKAKKKAKGTIMLTAHYDHLGRMGSETYFPGANDNASGVAMLLHLGQKLKAKPLRNYDVMCIAFAAEEIGLLGSKYLSEHPLFPLDAIKFQLNLDIMGSGEAGITAVNGLEFKREFKKLSRINKRLKSVPSVKARGRAANSDHHFFTEKGVKGFFIYTRGNNQNYHDIHDTYENLSFNSFENLSELFTTFLRRL
jgi:aminopeptidase-like protein